MKIDFFTIGCLSLDNIVLEDGRYLQSVMGGNALYSAIGCKLWNVNVGMVSYIGREDYPREKLDELSSAGIDISGIHVVDNPSEKFWILYEKTGRQTLPTLDYVGQEKMTPDGKDIPETYLNAQVAHISARPYQNQQALKNFLNRRKISVSLDTGEMHGLGIEGYREKGALNGISYFFPSSNEVKAIFGDSDEAAIRQLCTEAGVTILVIKKGAEGSLVCDLKLQRAWQVPAYRVNVVDPTGAGDAFCGGFIVGYKLDNDPRLAAAYGTVSASFVVETVGIKALKAKRKEVDNRLTQILREIREVSCA
ncbi:MAG: carbohydrate kinase family protein [Chloroflexi bacterium]|nr:carbohydrate kinase family protein [Chloroflexota bacterium]